MGDVLQHCSSVGYGKTCRDVMAIAQSVALWVAQREDQPGMVPSLPWQAAGLGFEAQ